MRAAAAFRVEHPLCANPDQNPRCTLVTTVVDHIVPHRGDVVLFWDQTNWQGLCASCHSSKTARETLA